MSDRIEQESGQTASTAIAVSRGLASKGISPGDISCNEVTDIYRSLLKIGSAPDFESIANSLPDKDIHAIRPSPPVWGVIVETRRHPALDFVVSNFVRNARIPVQIFHGRGNIDHIMATSISDLVETGAVHLTQLDMDELHGNQYNALLLSKSFWRNVLGRNKILIFQTDTICCTNSDYTLDDFLAFDYIGSKWPRHRPVGITIDGGSGGLSSRDWEKTYACLNRFPPRNWPGGEDGYFAFHMELTGCRIGKDRDCAKFSTQGEFLYRSWGCHQISCLQQKERIRFISYCEEARFMSNLISESSHSSVRPEDSAQS